MKTKLGRNRAVDATGPRLAKSSQSKRTKGKSNAIVKSKSHAVSQGRELTDEQRAFVDEYSKPLGGRGAGFEAPPFIAKPRKDGAFEVVRDPTINKKLWQAQMHASTGSRMKHVQEQIMVELYRICHKPGVQPPSELTNMLSGMLELLPQDAVEGRLAAQMICTHQVAMDFLGKGMGRDHSVELADFYLKHAERLLRLFTIQVESMNRYRGKASEQKMTVEHVHVHDGGQAIVGNVAPRTTGKGEGVDRADLWIPHAPCGAMWSKDAPEHPMLVAGDEKRPLSNARRPGT